MNKRKIYFLAVDNSQQGGDARKLKPKFITWSDDKVIKKGGTLNLSAHAEGPSPIKYRWFIGDIDDNEYRISTFIKVRNADKKSIVIKNFGQRHVGTYVCIAGNKYGETVSELIKVRMAD